MIFKPWYMQWFFSRPNFKRLLSCYFICSPACGRTQRPSAWKKSPPSSRSPSVYAWFEVFCQHCWVEPSFLFFLKQEKCGTLLFHQNVVGSRSNSGASFRATVGWSGVERLKSGAKSAFCGCFFCGAGKSITTWAMGLCKSTLQAYRGGNDVAMAGSGLSSRRFWHCGRQRCSFFRLDHLRGVCIDCTW